MDIGVEGSPFVVESAEQVVGNHYLIQPLREISQGENTLYICSESEPITGLVIEVERSDPEVVSRTKQLFVLTIENSKSEVPD
jgi:hypothetical protein